MKKTIVVGVTIMLTVIFGLLGVSLLTPFKADPNNLIYNTTSVTTWKIGENNDVTYSVDPLSTEQGVLVTWELLQGGTVVDSKVRVTGLQSFNTTALTAGTYKLRLTAHFTDGDKNPDGGDVTIIITPIVYNARVKVNGVVPTGQSITTPFKVGEFMFSYDIIGEAPTPGVVRYDFGENLGALQSGSGPHFIDTKGKNSCNYIVRVSLDGQEFFTNFIVEYHELESFVISINPTTVEYQGNIKVEFDDFKFFEGRSLLAQSQIPEKYVDTNKVFTMNIGGQNHNFTLGTAITEGYINFPQSLAVGSGHIVEVFSGSTSMSAAKTFSVDYAPVKISEVTIGGFGVKETPAEALQIDPIKNVTKDDSRFFYKNTEDFAIRINDSANPNTFKKLWYSTNGGADYYETETMMTMLKGDVTYLMRAEIGTGPARVYLYWAFECVFKPLTQQGFKLVYNSIPNFTTKAKVVGSTNTVLVLTYQLNDGVDDTAVVPKIKYGENSNRSSGITFGAINTANRTVTVTLAGPLDVGQYMFYMEWTSGFNSQPFTLVVKPFSEDEDNPENPMNYFLQFVLLAVGAVAVIIVGSVIYDKWLKKYFAKRSGRDRGKESSEK